MCAVMIFGAVPAYAAETAAVSEFDFSDVDTLASYDAYPKEISEDGYEYVETYLLNRIDTTSTKTFADYRYGAYLENAADQHYYSVFNLNYGGKISSNVLTIYADTAVAFEVTDVTGALVASSVTTNYDVSKVEEYNKSIDNGHNVYYIEFKPMATGESTLMIRFSTNSATAQPHYSFWFGHPLTREGSKQIGLLQMVIGKPNTSSANFGIVATSLPRESWVTSVSVKKSQEMNKAWINNAYFTVLTPGETTNSNSVDAKAASTAVFNFDVDHYSAHSAYGTYYFKFSRVNWNTQLSGAATYTYIGNATVNYLYAFGA